MTRVQSPPVTEGDGDDGRDYGEAMCTAGWLPHGVDYVPTSLLVYTGGSTGSI